MGSIAGTTIAFVVVAMLGQGRALADDAAVPAHDEGHRLFAIEGGMESPLFGAELRVQTLSGLIMGAAVGPVAVGARLGYQRPLSEHWAMLSTVRAVELWGREDGGSSAAGAFQFVLVDMGIRYQGASGFVFEYGLPLFGLIPTGPSAGPTQPHWQAYNLAQTSDLTFFQSLLIGYAF